MSFHKRWITSEAILSSYKSGGIGAVWDMFTRGADALILDGDLARECDRLIKAGEKGELQCILASLDK
jgi:hypothetical protein